MCSLIDYLFSTKTVNLASDMFNWLLHNDIAPHCAMFAFMMIFFHQHSNTELDDWKPFWYILHLTTLLFMMKQNPRVLIGNLGVSFAFTVATPLWNMWSSIPLLWSTNTFARVHYTMFVISSAQLLIGFEMRVQVEKLLNLLWTIVSKCTPLKWMVELHDAVSKHKVVSSSWDWFCSGAKKLGECVLFGVVAGLLFFVGYCAGWWKDLAEWLTKAMIHFGTNVMTFTFGIIFFIFALWYVSVCAEETKVQDHTRVFVLCTAMIVSMSHMSPPTTCSLKLYNKKTNDTQIGPLQCDDSKKTLEISNMVSKFESEQWQNENNDTKNSNVTGLVIQNFTSDLPDPHYLQCCVLLILSLSMVCIVEKKEDTS